MRRMIGVMRKPSSRQVKIVVAGTVALAAFLVTPYFLYRETGFGFGARELRAAVEGTWQVETARPGGAPELTTVVIRQARGPVQLSAGRGLIRSAEACGNRSLIASAEACLDTTEMPLELRAPNRRGVVGRGRLFVGGLHFNAGELTIEIRGHTVVARITPHGHVLEVYPTPGEPKASLRRLHR